MVWKKRANYFVGERAIGGTLLLGETVLAFHPHALERLLGENKRYEVQLKQITDVRCEVVGLVPRERIVVRAQGRPDALFLVPTGRDRAAEIGERAQRMRSGDD